MKKNVAAYRLFNSHIVPLSMCSLMNPHSLVNLVWDSLMFRLISITGAPGFNLMAWFHNLFGGNFFDSLSSNTLM